VKADHVKESKDKENKKKSGISMLCGGGKNSLSESTNASHFSNGKNIPKIIF
jgi:hypothetical protein